MLRLTGRSYDDISSQPVFRPKLTLAAKNSSLPSRLKQALIASLIPSLTW